MIKTFASGPVHAPGRIVTRPDKKQMIVFAIQVDSGNGNFSKLPCYFVPAEEKSNLDEILTMTKKDSVIAITGNPFSYTTKEGKQTISRLALEVEYFNSFGAGTRPEPKPDDKQTEKRERKLIPESNAKPESKPDPIPEPKPKPDDKPKAKRKTGTKKTA